MLMALACATARFRARPLLSLPIPTPLMASKMYQKLQDHVNSLEDDFSKFYDKGNKAAGTRVRKGMQELKSMAQDIRIDVQDKKNG